MLVVRRQRMAYMTMIPFEEMPEDNDDLAHVQVTFPLLAPNTADSCPLPLSDVVEYLRLETMDGPLFNGDRLHFLRSAQVGDRRYWIWSFDEPDGSGCYATVSQSPDGSSCIGYDENSHGLTPEQFMLGDYHNVF